jgi:hypothetical protein
MTPKEKAKDLIDKFSTRLKVLHELEGWVEHIDSSKAKGHALTAVNLLLNDKHKTEDFNMTYNFWQEVKQELEKL